MPVRKADLGPLTKISEGGFGVVYRIAQYRMPGDPTTPLAYKEFTKDVVEQAKAAERSVIFRDLLQPATGRTWTGARFGRGRSSRTGVPWSASSCRSSPATFSLR